MYSEQAPDTYGGRPIVSSTGLKITPPPRPSAPASNPPMNPSTIKIVVFRLSKMMSVSTRLMPPYLSFNFYSERRISTEIATISPQKAINPKKITQYQGEHCVIPNGDFLDLLGRVKFIKNRQRISDRLMSHFLPYKLPCSDLTIEIRRLSSLSDSSLSPMMNMY